MHVVTIINIISYLHFRRQLWIPAAGSALQDVIPECYVLVRTSFLYLTFSSTVHTQSR